MVLHDRRGEIQGARPGEGAGSGVGCVGSHPAGVPDTDVEGAVDPLKPPLQPLGVHHQVDGVGRAGDLGRPPGVELTLAAGFGEEGEAPGGRDQEHCGHRTLGVAQPGQQLREGVRVPRVVEQDQEGVAALIRVIEQATPPP